MPDVCLCRHCCNIPDRLLTRYRCVAVKTLPLNTDVEIECIATL